jgi:hypothetical protein
MADLILRVEGEFEDAEGLWAGQQGFDSWQVQRFSLELRIQTSLLSDGY